MYINYDIIDLSNKDKGIIAMNYQTFVDKLNEKEFIKTIEDALGYNVDVFVNVEEDLSVTNRFDVMITMVVEKMHKFFNSEEKYLLKVDLDYDDVYEDAELSMPFDKDQMRRFLEMGEAIEKYFMEVFDGE